MFGERQLRLSPYPQGDSFVSKSKIEFSDKENRDFIFVHNCPNSNLIVFIKHIVKIFGILTLMQ